MNCSRCGHDTEVIDSRPRGTFVWRRRECIACHRRFTTYEFREKYEP